MNLPFVSRSVERPTSENFTGAAVLFVAVDVSDWVVESLFITVEHRLRLFSVHGIPNFEFLVFPRSPPVVRSPWWYRLFFSSSFSVALWGGAGFRVLSCTPWYTLLC